MTASELLYADLGTWQLFALTRTEQSWPFTPIMRRKTLLPESTRTRICHDDATHRPSQRKLINESYAHIHSHQGLQILFLVCRSSGSEPECSSIKRLVEFQDKSLELVSFPSYPVTSSSFKTRSILRFCTVAYCHAIKLDVLFHLSYLGFYLCKCCASTW